MRKNTVRILMVWSMVVLTAFLASFCSLPPTKEPLQSDGKQQQDQSQQGTNTLQQEQQDTDASGASDKLPTVTSPN